MNIFVVDHDPIVAAQNLCDKHVVKMIVESAQMLSTAHRVLDGTPYTDSSSKRKIKRWRHPDDITDQKLCKAVMVNHPCTVWTVQSTHNYSWLYVHGLALCAEYTFRYGKVHSMQTLYNDFLSKVPIALIKNFKNALTPYAQAMPDKYRNSEDAILAYRNYYINEKNKFAKWTRREVPMWYTQGISVLNTNSIGAATNV